jgi:hypothetical protein
MKADTLSSAAGTIKFSENSENLRKFGGLSLRYKPQLLDAGFECGWLDVEKRRSSVRSSNTPIALFNGLQDNYPLGFVE